MQEYVEVGDGVAEEVSDDALLGLQAASVRKRAALCLSPSGQFLIYFVVKVRLLYSIKSNN